MYVFWLFVDMDFRGHKMQLGAAKHMSIRHRTLQYFNVTRYSFTFGVRQIP